MYCKITQWKLFQAATAEPLDLSVKQFEFYSNHRESKQTFQI